MFVSEDGAPAFDSSNFSSCFCCILFLTYNTGKPPHGPVFKRWADRAMRIYPQLEITTCHNYEINYAHNWSCMGCNQVYGRHSNSLDVDKKCCGKCRGKLLYMGRSKQDGTPAQPRRVSAYNKFVKEHYAAVQAQVKSAGGEQSQQKGVIMQRLGELWKQQQQEQQQE